MSDWRTLKFPTVCPVMQCREPYIIARRQLSWMMYSLMLLNALCCGRKVEHVAFERLFLKSAIEKSRYQFFSSPGRSPGRAIVLPPALASALAKNLTLKFFM